MATVASVLTTHGINTFVDRVVGDRLVRHYDTNGQSQANVLTAGDDLQSNVDSSTVVLGGVEPDVVLLQSAINQTVLVK